MNAFFSCFSGERLLRSSSLQGGETALKLGGDISWVRKCFSGVISAKLGII